MANFNKVMLLGRLTKDPDLRYTPGGNAVCDMRLATSSTWKDKNGDSQEERLFIDVTAWGRQAETCNQYLSKGREVFVEGRLMFEEWENKEGQKRSKHSVTAQKVQFIGSGKDDEGGGRQNDDRGRQDDRRGDSRSNSRNDSRGRGDDNRGRDNRNDNRGRQDSRRDDGGRRRDEPAPARSGGGGGNAWPDDDDVPF